MPILLDTDFGNGWAGAFVAGTEGGHASQVRLKREHDDVVHRAQIITELLQRNRSVHPGAIRRCDLGARNVEPLIRSLGTQLDFADRGEVLLQSPLVRLAKLAIQRGGFVDYGVENTAAPLQAASLFVDAALGFFKQFAEHHARVCLSRQSDAVGVVRQRMPLIAQLDGRESRLRRRYGRHQLVNRDRVAFGLSNLRTGQPNAAAIVMMPQSTWMVHAADRCDHVAVLGQCL